MTLAVCAIFLLGADVFESTFDAAGAAYGAGDYATAIEMYEQLVGEDVVDEVVFYNLGNAYYRQGWLGPAIANYERALRLKPGFENARRNLDKAVNDTKTRLSKPLPADWELNLLFWHYKLAPKATRLIAGLLWIAFWSVLGIRQWRAIRYTRQTALVLGMLAMLFVLSAWAKSHPLALAAANAVNVPVRYGTDANETIHFNLHAGDRVAVDVRQDGWARVTSVDGKRGWAREESLAFVGPPYERPSIPSPDAASDIEAIP